MCLGAGVGVRACFDDLHELVRQTHQEGESVSGRT